MASTAQWFCRADCGIFQQDAENDGTARVSGMAAL